jgi:hypothetical protein
VVTCDYRFVYLGPAGSCTPVHSGEGRFRGRGGSSCCCCCHFVGRFAAGDILLCARLAHVLKATWPLLSCALCNRQKQAGREAEGVP